MKVVPTLIGIALVVIGFAAALPDLPSLLTGWLTVGLLGALSLTALLIALRPAPPQTGDQ